MLVPFPDSWMEKPAFGTALEEHLKRSNREIALPIEACVMMLLETGMKEEVWVEMTDELLLQKAYLSCLCSTRVQLFLKMLPLEKLSCVEHK